MSASAKKEIPNNETKKRESETIEVLYQKMGDRWYAFSCVDDEVFFAAISPDEIDVIRRHEKI